MVGLVTCYFHPNYGSMLQAYATQKIMEEWNVPCENICIDGLKGEIEQSKVQFYLRQVNNPQVLSGTIVRIIKKKVYQKALKKTLGRNLKIRNACFQNFVKKNFIVSRRYDSKQQLTEASKQYSAVVVGSDQLWLPSNIEADYYTLNWVPDDVPKIAFSTSFGTSFLPKKQQGMAKQFLNRFQAISVREETGKKMIQEYAGLDVPVVCDPTLLFNGEDWMCIQKKAPIVKDKYILCYFLGNNKEDRQFAQRLREYTGYKIVALLHLDEYIKADNEYADETPYDIGPGELLNLIRNAEYIVTDSFHGSVFSIIYKKRFFTSRRVRKEGILCTNNRLDSLFDKLGVEGRLIDGSENVEECLKRTVDYNKVHSNLNALVTESKEYLRNALNLQ